MNIKSKVRIYEKEGSNIKGFASISIDDVFAVRDLKIFDGKNGYFISMPNRKVGEKYEDICFPLNKELRDEITACVLEEYEKEFTKKNNTSNQKSDLPF